MSAAGRAPSATVSGWRRVGLLIARLMMDAALVDAGVETWLAGSPNRWWVVAPIALYVALSLWSLAQGSRLAAPGFVTQTPAAFYVLLGILVALTQDPAGLSVGVVMLKLPMPTLLTATLLLVAGLATIRIASPRGTAMWWRIVILALGAYAVTGLALGTAHGIPLNALLRGHGQWHRLPYWLQGAYLGGVVLIPVAFARELIISMKVLTLRGHLRWMVVFALGAWITINGM